MKEINGKDVDSFSYKDSGFETQDILFRRHVIYDY
jgi:hypothetical protein